jgi:hypothetical protein
LAIGSPGFGLLFTSSSVAPLPRITQVPTNLLSTKRGVVQQVKTNDIAATIIEAATLI